MQASRDLNPLPIESESSDLSRSNIFTSAQAYGSAFLIVVCAYIAMHMVQARPVFPLDDPYITLHSAQVLHWGHDPNFPGVSALYGVTSAPFLLLLYLLLFVMSPLHALDAACWLGVLAYVSGLVRLSRQFRLKPIESVLLAGLGLIGSFIPFHLLNGLETPWAFAAVTWALALSSGDRDNWEWAALAGGIGASIRPDLLPFALLLALALTYQVYKTEGDLDTVRKSAALFVLFALLPIVLCAAWYYEATGTAHTLTATAKHYLVLEAAISPAKTLLLELQVIAVYLLSCGPLFVAMVRVWRYPIAKAIVLSLVLTILIAHLQFPFALYLNHYRYLIVFVPAMVWATGMVLKDGRGRWHGRGLLYGSVVYSLLWLQVPISLYRLDCWFYDGELHLVAEWCTSNLPRNATVMVHDAGYISFASDFRLVDLVGLKTPEAIALNKRYTWPSRGARRNEAVAALAQRTNAQYLIARRTWDIMAAVPDGLRELGWKVDPLRMDGEYCVYRITPPPR